MTLPWMDRTKRGHLRPQFAISLPQAHHPQPPLSCPARRTPHRHGNIKETFLVRWASLKPTHTHRASVYLPRCFCCFCCSSSCFTLHVYNEVQFTPFSRVYVCVYICKWETTARGAGPTCVCTHRVYCTCATMMMSCNIRNMDLTGAGERWELREKERKGG